MKTQTILVLLAILTIISSGCYNDKAELLYPAVACDTAGVTYSGTIRNITMQNCALSNCHDAGSQMGGVLLDNVAGVQTIALNGRLLAVIGANSTANTMPKDRARLDDCSIKKIAIWVNAGALNN